MKIKVSKQPAIVYDLNDYDDVDYDFQLDIWSYLMEELTKMMKKKTDDIYWRVKGYNMGWRLTDGYKDIVARDGSDIIREILPKTDCHFNIYNWRNGLAIQNFHHDSPAGAEWYTVVPIKESTFEGR